MPGEKDSTRNLLKMFAAMAAAIAVMMLLTTVMRDSVPEYVGAVVSVAASLAVYTMVSRALNSGAPKA